MSTNLPLLLENQTLYSWCGRTHELNCSASARRTSSQPFGTPYAALCHDFPAHLQVLTQRTGGQLGPPRELALRHTLLGYFLSITDHEVADRTLRLVTDGAVPSLEDALSICRASRAVGISATTGVQWAGRLGISYTSRSKTVTPLLSGKVRKQLTRGERVAKIAASSGVSASTVNRILGADDDLKAARHRSTFSHRSLVARSCFVRLCKIHAHLPLSELRKLPGNGYAWLYRNDREWLSETLRRFGRLAGRPSKGH